MIVEGKTGWLPQPPLQFCLLYPRDQNAKNYLSQTPLELSFWPDVSSAGKITFCETLNWVKLGELQNAAHDFYCLGYWQEVTAAGMASELDGNSLNSAAAGCFLTLAEVAGSEGCSSSGSFQIHHLLVTLVGAVLESAETEWCWQQEMLWELSSEAASAALGGLHGHIIPHVKSHFV